MDWRVDGVETAPGPIVIPAEAGIHPGQNL